MFLLGRELTGSARGRLRRRPRVRLRAVPHRDRSRTCRCCRRCGCRSSCSACAVTSRRAALRPLAGAAAAWIAQNLSCGYYLLFFSPVVLLYIAWELTTRGLWSDRRALAARRRRDARSVLAATVPFLLPYLELRRLGFSPRSLTETKRFSADVYAYLTADPNLRLWGPIARAWPKAEGLLFPGLTIVVLAAFGAASALATATRRREAAASTVATRDGLRLPIAVRASRSPVGVRRRLLLGWSIRAAGAARSPSLSRALRRRGDRRHRAHRGVGARADGAAPRGWRRRSASSRSSRSSRSRCRSVPRFTRRDERSPTPASTRSFYRLRARLRRPARAGALRDDRDARPRGARRARRRRRSIAGGRETRRRGRRRADRRSKRWRCRFRSTRTPRVRADGPRAAAAVARDRRSPRRRSIASSRSLPASAVLLELPLGEPAFDMRYMFYSTRHWQRLVNGYSGGAPLDVRAPDRGAEGRRHPPRPGLAGDRRLDRHATPSSTKAPIADERRSPFRRLAPRARRPRSGRLRHGPRVRCLLRAATARIDHDGTQPPQSGTVLDGRAVRSRARSRSGRSRLHHLGSKPMAGLGQTLGTSREAASATWWSSASCWCSAWTASSPTSASRIWGPGIEANPLISSAMTAAGVGAGLGRREAGRDRLRHAAAPPARAQPRRAADGHLLRRRDPAVDGAVSDALTTDARLRPSRYAWTLQLRATAGESVALTRTRRIKLARHAPRSAGLSSARELDSLKQQGLYRHLRILDGEQSHKTTFDHRQVVNLSSNNYLGLTTHPRLRETALEAIARLGVGSGSVRIDRRHDGHPHGARAPAGGVQEDRSGRRLPERLRRERRHRRRRLNQGRRRHLRRAESREHHRRRAA